MTQNLAGRNLTFDDPRQIPYDAYLAMTEEEAEAIEDHFNAGWYPIYLNVLREQGAEWLLVCGEEVVLTSNEAALPNSEEIERLAREKNRIPFLVSPPVEIEESGWHSTHYPGDGYPTLTVVVEGPSVELPIVSDFDTGSPCCFFDLDQLEQTKILAPVRRPHVVGMHLGLVYKYRLMSLLLKIVDETHQAKSRTVNIRAVRNWVGGPFQRINPQREALTGRDLLRLFRFKLELDGDSQKTRVYHS